MKMTALPPDLLRKTEKLVGHDVITLLNAATSFVTISVPTDSFDSLGNFEFKSAGVRGLKLFSSKWIEAMDDDHTALSCAIDPLLHYNSRPWWYSHA